MSIERWRLGSGLVLLAFVLGHFTNHTLGLVSIETMNSVLFVTIAPWRTPVGTTLLAGAALAHVAVALRALYRRRSLRMTRLEAAQFVLGFTIPFLLAQHVLGTRVVAGAFGVQTEYVYVLSMLWLVDPRQGFLQAVLVLVAWGHACIGLHYWLRVKPWYEAARPAPFVLALLIPTLALAGYAAASFDLMRRARADDFLAGVIERARLGAEASSFVTTGAVSVQVGFALAILAVLAARFLRQVAGRRGRARLTYPDGRIVDAPPGATVLEASRSAGIPHAAVCGGKGRCSTCRVRLGAGAGDQPPPNAEERRVLDRIGAVPNIRLACQLRPIGRLEVTPLLSATATAREGRRREANFAGREREIAILFADLRGFTKFSDTKLPYDIVFLLNRYFEAMGRAVENAQGRVDKFIGDGVMALFGVESGPAIGCRRALVAARTMAIELDRLNEALAADLPSPLRMGIGIHVGPAIVGEMGYGHAKALTAVGDAVNIASRLEGLTKELEVQLVMSAAVADHAGIALADIPSRDIAVRGKDGMLSVYPVPLARTLPAD
ncbi:adenylate/guanylate cyclase domain-containing protein [Inquilinus sp. CAU 1745]|uniref:adenylate/guanylate cyclase domain-containing protein n=1 Tax=Inquilinus sp. CAU 1745 TaxID=3140369 RepID=UPI00325B0379